MRRPLADKRRGYPHADEISFTQVKRVLKIVQSRSAEVKAHTSDGLAYYSVEDAQRYYWVYVPNQKETA